MKIEHEDYYDQPIAVRRQYDRESISRNTWSYAFKKVFLWAEAVLLIGIAILLICAFGRSIGHSRAAFDYLVSSIAYCSTIFILLYFAGRLWLSFEFLAWEKEFEKKKLLQAWNDSIKEVQADGVIVDDDIVDDGEAEEEDKPSIYNTDKPTESIVKTDWLLVQQYRSGVSLNQLALEKYNNKGGFYIGKIKEILRNYGERV